MLGIAAVLTRIQTGAAAPLLHLRSLNPHLTSLLAVSPQVSCMIKCIARKWTPSCLCQALIANLFSQTFPAHRPVSTEAGAAGGQGRQSDRAPGGGASAGGAGGNSCRWAVALGRQLLRLSGTISTSLCKATAELLFSMCVAQNTGPMHEGLVS